MSDAWFDDYAAGDFLPDESTPDERSLSSYAQGYADAIGAAALTTARIAQGRYWEGYADGIEDGAGLRDSGLPLASPAAKLMPRMSADRQHLEVVAYHEHQGETEAIVVGRLDRAAATRMALMSSEWLLLWDSGQREYQEERRAEQEADDKLRPPVPVEPELRRWAPRRRERSLSRPGGRR